LKCGASLKWIRSQRKSYVDHKEKQRYVKFNQAKRRRMGIDRYLQEREIAVDHVVVEYYAVSGKCLNRKHGGFLHQLGCCKRDGRANAILMVGGWNNETVYAEDLQTFRMLLDNDDAAVNYWGGAWY